MNKFSRIMLKTGVKPVPIAKLAESSKGRGSGSWRYWTEAVCEG